MLVPVKAREENGAELGRHIRGWGPKSLAHPAQKCGKKGKAQRTGPIFPSLGEGHHAYGIDRIS